MNRQQAKALDKFLDSLTDENLDQMVEVGLLDANVLANYSEGHIEAFGEGADIRMSGGVPHEDLAFDSPPGYYKIHEPEIDWHKAMRHEAWGEEFMFRNKDCDDWSGPYILLGYMPEDICQFRSESFGWMQCKPVDGFSIPKEWLK
jgi:hypothetical protein